MTEEQIVALREIALDVVALPNKHTEQLQQLEKSQEAEYIALRDRFTELAAQCDHHNPDGSSAFDGSHHYARCMFCGFSNFRREHK